VEKAESTSPSTASEVAEGVAETAEPQLIHSVEHQKQDAMDDLPHPAPAAATSAPAKVEPKVAPMYIVQITPELAPIAKVGGLADVVMGLSAELEDQGNTVEIILPKYDNMRYDKIRDLHVCFNDLYVPWYGGQIHCSVWYGSVLGRKCFFIESHSNDIFFNRGSIYGFQNDVMRFAFFCRAALEYMLKSNKRPEIIHCHDWPTGLVPVMLYEIYKWHGMEHCRACYTIHNFKHQGIFGDTGLHATGLGRPDYYFSGDKLRDNANGRVLNMMKGGIVYSNFTTTVSPHYAYEARNSWQGFGMGGTLNAHQGKYGGVINGLDYNYWNPETDIYIPHHYSTGTIAEKYKNKAALRQRMWLADGVKPIVAFVGRLDGQKGLGLIKHGLFHSLRSNAQFVLLGSSPDNKINGEFWGLKNQVNNSPDCHLEIGFNEELAHLIYAGADMLIVPSEYEPCGLTQLIALRYGTVPVVRGVGGLADTVIDKDFSDRPLHERNGYLFNDGNTGALEWALNRAIACYYQYPNDFRALMLNGMRTDNSWKTPATHYLHIYDYIRDK
jgi:starch synthase